jgi:hypothetical protein
MCLNTEVDEPCLLVNASFFRRKIMSRTLRFGIGGLGGLLPLIASLVAIDLNAIATLIDNHALTEGICIGYSIRTIGLFFLGGIMAALNTDVVNPLSIIQIGIAAPALITSYLAGAAIPNHTASFMIISNAYADETHHIVNSKIAGGLFDDILSGTKPGLGADAYIIKKDAADQINRQSAFTVWHDTNMTGDWVNHDYDSSVGNVPQPGKCTPANRNLVAVCWTSNHLSPAGDQAWCTYKQLTKATPFDGPSPGKIWSCE